ncbi:hypothetical protein OG407_24030 [Streptomyces sp. NBC_01515]|uniref:hypothetical protein n=1 Tax=Streptomyces sp. NBC_01515 TaxID=2903890 RepID=UPI00386BCF43
MEAAAQWVAIVVIVLVAIGYAIQGLAWLFDNERVYLILGVGALCVLAVAYYRLSRPVKAPVDTKVIVAQARQAERLLVESRRALEREAESLKNLRLEVRDEVNFEVYRQAHRESRIIADRWHKHKRSAIETRSGISVGLSKMREKKRNLDRRSSSSSQMQRRRVLQEVQATQSVIDNLQGAMSSLNSEVDRGAKSLTSYNQQTGRLRDHIRDNCGPKGKRWFAQLEERKNRIIDN